MYIARPPRASKPTPSRRGARPCAGALCAAARSRGLPGRSVSGSLLRCAPCRAERRCKDAAACLTQALGARGSPLRRELLYKVVSLDSLSAVLAAGPVFQGKPPPQAAAIRTAALAGVPFLNSQGACCHPIAGPTVAEAVDLLKARRVSFSGCLGCGTVVAPALHCAVCGVRLCDPRGGGCSILSEAGAMALGGQCWVCPDCRQLISERLARGEGSSAALPQTANPAQAHMDALVSATAAYPEHSAPLGSVC